MYHSERVCVKKYDEFDVPITLQRLFAYYADVLVWYRYNNFVLLLTDRDGNLQEILSTWQAFQSFIKYFKFLIAYNKPTCI